MTGSILDLEARASAVRRQILRALAASAGGHYGGSLSVVEILLVLVHHILRDGPDRLRDRLVFSKGHAAIALYAVLHDAGRLATPLDGYGRFCAGLEGHPDMRETPGIDFSSGSLGMGLSVALGMAIATRNDGARAWAILGDGECQEGQIWEAAMLAGRLQIANVRVVIDANGHQEYGYGTAVADARPVHDLGPKFRAFGWHVVECDGHDVGALQAACIATSQHPGPVAIVAQTRKGYGYPLIESDPRRFHCAPHDAELAALLGDDT